MRRLLLLAIFAFCLGYGLRANASFDTNTLSEVHTKLGLNAWLVEEHALPIITIKITFLRAGSAFDPPGLEGLSNLLTLLLDEGAGELDATSFKRTLEDNAIELSFETDKENFSITLKTLSENIETALHLLGTALYDPHLSEDALARARNQVLFGLQKNRENPSYIAQVTWDELVFGNHPYARPMEGTSASLANISSGTLGAFMEQHFARSNMVISVVGDINERQLSGLLDEHFGRLPEQEAEGHIIDNFKGIQKADTKYIEHSIGQSVILFGQNGIRFLDPDFYPAYVLNHILGGGGFQSRLVDEIREKRGMAYSAYTFLAPMPHSSHLRGYVATQRNHVNDVLSIIRNEFEDVRDNGVSESELDAAKKYLIGSFALKMDTNEKLADYLNFIQIEGLGLNFLERRNFLIEAVTTEDIKRVAGTLLTPDKFVTVIVGGESGNGRLPAKPEGTLPDTHLQ